MKRLHIERLQLRLKGVDARTAEAAARLLGPALAGRLASAASAGGAQLAPGPLRLAARPDAERLSGAVAARVAGEVRSRVPLRSAAGKRAV